MNAFELTINTILEFNHRAGWDIFTGGSPKIQFPMHSDRQILLFQQGDKCFYCDKKIYHPDRMLKPIATVDHVIPKAAGGINSLENKVMACAPCNEAKGCMSQERFMEIRGLSQ